MKIDTTKLKTPKQIEAAIISAIDYTLNEAASKNKTEGHYVDMSDEWRRKTSWVETLSRRQSILNLKAQIVTAIFYSKTLDTPNEETAIPPDANTMLADSACDSSCEFHATTLVNGGICCKTWREKTEASISR